MDRASAPLSFFSLDRRAALLAGVGLLAAPAIGRAQTASGPIRIVVGVAAGGLTDAFARAYGDHMGRALNRTIVVENRPGASGGIAATAVKGAAPDGQTLLMTISTTFFANRLTIPNLQYDPDKDFEVLSIVPAGHIPLIVRNDTRATNLAEFVAFASANNASLGTYGAGSLPHLYADILTRRTTRPVAAVHYRGEAPMWQDLAGGSLQAAGGTYLAARSVLDSGIARAIAVPTDKRMRRLPDVPTFAEQGFVDPVFNLKTWVGFFAHSGTATDILDRYSQVIVEAGMTDPIVRLRETFAIDDPAMSRAESKALYTREAPVWLDAVRRLNLQPS